MLDSKLLLNDIAVFDHGKKSRYKYNGRGIPSVTELLSFIDSQGLINWANNIGLKGINNKDILKESSDFGTMVHEQIEYYIKKKKIETEPTVCLEAFKVWWHGINECHRIKVLGQERPMISPYFAGTYDLLISIDDKPFLVDFKTSNHVGYKYFMQLAAYRHLLYTTRNINIQGCIILQFNKDKPEFKEYALDFSDPYHYEFIENCFRSFMGLVYTYYNVKQAGRQFRDIF